MQKKIIDNQEGHGRSAATPERVWIALAHCYRTMSNVIEKSFVDSGLSLTDFMLLEALLHKGPMTITSIQASALLATGSMTAAVDRLETRGWMVRTASKDDRRTRLLVLTEDGRQIITLAYQEHSSNLKRWMSVLSPEERSSAFNALRKLTKQLKPLSSSDRT